MAQVNSAEAETSRPQGYKVWRYPNYGKGKFQRSPFSTALDKLSRDADLGDIRAGWDAVPLRGLFMAQVGDLIRDKPGWMEKIESDEIWNKWIEEMRRNQEVTPAMDAYMRDELRYWAKRYKSTPEASRCLPGIEDVWKYDFVSTELKEALRRGAAVLENVPDRFKDWHPGTNERVLDLVHPSLFPIMYGITRVVDTPLDFKSPDFVSKYAGGGTSIYRFKDAFPNKPDESPHTSAALNDFLDSNSDEEMNDGGDEDDDEDDEENGNGNGNGNAEIPYIAEKMSIDPHEDARIDESLELYEEKVYSRRYCWLPTDFQIDGNNNCTPLGYINNLHPKHTELYDTISKVLSRCIPLWDNTLTSSINERIVRVPNKRGPWRTGTVEELATVPPSQWRYDDREEMLASIESEYYDGVFLDLPDAVEFNPPTVLSIVKLRDFEKIQVIVKMANIQLTPEKPNYEGGTWHVEGASNERIVATGIYYYDSENVEENKLHFRQACSIPSYEQSDDIGVKLEYGLAEQLNQNLGYVVTREDRLLAFPNIYQHRVSGFSLKDKTKPGHRKILCFFLIDPFHPILSTSLVPPQQREWWDEAIDARCNETRLLNTPTEVYNIIKEGVEWPMSLSDAKKHRERLMKERTRVQRSAGGNFVREFTLCEH